MVEGFAKPNEKKGLYFIQLIFSVNEYPYGTFAGIKMMFSARPEGGSRITNTATIDNAAEDIILMPIRLFAIR
jgi:hypothetical protein